MNFIRRVGDALQIGWLERTLEADVYFDLNVIAVRSFVESYREEGFKLYSFDELTVGKQRVVRIRYRYNKITVAVTFTEQLRERFRNMYFHHVS